MFGMGDDIKVVEGGGGDAVPPSRDVVEECMRGVIEEFDVIAGGRSQ